MKKQKIHYKLYFNFIENYPCICLIKYELNTIKNLNLLTIFFIILQENIICQLYEKTIYIYIIVFS